MKSYFGEEREEEGFRINLQRMEQEGDGLGEGGQQ